MTPYQQIMADWCHAKWKGTETDAVDRLKAIFAADPAQLAVSKERLQYLKRFDEICNHKLESRDAGGAAELKLLEEAFGL